MDIILVLLHGHRDYGNIDLLVDAFLPKSILQNVACSVGNVVSYFYSLSHGLDGLCVYNLLGCVEMAHNQAEDPEEHKEQCQTEENDSHGQKRDADSVWVLTLQFSILGLVGLDEILDAGSNVLWRFYAPLVAVSGIALVCSHCRHADGVDKLFGITIVKTDPYRFRHGNR